MSESGRRKRTDALALALASGETVRDAAKVAGVGEATAHRRLKDPSFRKMVDQMRDAALADALARLAAKTCAAVDVVGNLLASEDERTRLAAAKLLITTLVKNRDTIAPKPEVFVAVRPRNFPGELD